MSCSRGSKSSPGLSGGHVTGLSGGHVTGLSGGHVTPPKFAPTPSLHVEPVYLPDREIFDFTDSRFIKPFPENLANYPLVLPASRDVTSLAPASQFQVP